MVEKKKNKKGKEHTDTQTHRHNVWSHTIARLFGDVVSKGVSGTRLPGNNRYLIDFEILASLVTPGAGANLEAVAIGIGWSSLAGVDLCEVAETPLDELNLLELGLRFPFVDELFKTRRLEEREGMEAEVNAWVESSSTTLCLIKDEALRLRGLNILDNMVRWPTLLVSPGIWSVCC